MALFNAMILNVYDKHAPLRKIKLKHPPAPWLNDTIKLFISKRDRARRHYARLPSDANWLRYKAIRNKCNRLCREAKRVFIHDTIKKSNPEQTWKFLKSLGMGKNTANGDIVLDLNDLNTHFSKPPLVLDNVTKSITLHNLASLPLPQCVSFQFKPVTECDINKHVFAISSPASGNDGICSKMITLILSELLPILSHIFNFSLTSSTFPTIWKNAHIVPLPKKTCPSTPSDCRPISILPFLAKVLEHIVNKQLNDYLLFNNLLSPYQSGFRRGHSTATTLIKVTDDIRRAMDDRKLTVLLLLDFSNAFNSIDFDILLGILLSLNISSNVVDWFRSYLVGRSQRVRVKDLFSNWCKLSAGVPQGGVLSPLLFSIFINTVTYLISSHFHLYADDLQLYRHFNVEDLVSAFDAINTDLDNIHSWAKSFGLVLNPSKSQALLIGSRFLHNSIGNSSIPQLKYNDSIINLNSTGRNLGLIFSSDFSWVAYTNHIHNKVYRSFHSLKHLQNFLPFKTKISLVQTLIFPIIDYADSCYPDATEEILDRLERLQNVCIRYIFGLRKFDHISSFRKKLGWLPIRLRRNSRLLSLLYNILFNPSYPSYLRDRFDFLYPLDLPCRPCVRNLLRVPVHNTSYFSSSFSVRAVKLWNSLPHSIRTSESLDIFKNRLKQYYLSIA